LNGDKIISNNPPKADFIPPIIFSPSNVKTPTIISTAPFIDPMIPIKTVFIDSNVGCKKLIIDFPTSSKVEPIFLNTVPSAANDSDNPVFSIISPNHEKIPAVAFAII